MNDFENSPEYRAAKAAYESRQKFADAGRDFMDNANTLSEKMQKGVERKLSRAAAAKRLISHQLDKWFTAKKESASKGLDNTKKAVKGFFNRIKQSLSAGKDSLNQELSNIGYDLKDFGKDISILGGDIKEDLSKIGKPVATVARATVHTFALGAGAVIGGAAIAAKAGYDLGKEGYNAAKESGRKFLAHANTLSEKMQKGVERKLSRAAAAKRLISHQLNKWFTAKKESASKSWDNTKKSTKGFFNKIGKALSSGKDTLSEGFINSCKALSNEFKGFGKDMRALGGDIKETALKGLETVGKPVVTVARATANTFALGAGAVVGGAALAVKAGYNLGKEGYTAVKEDLKGFGKDMRALGGDISGSFKDVKSAAGKTWGQVVVLGKEKGEQFRAGANKVIVGGKTFGLNIIKRIKSGVDKQCVAVSQTLSACKDNIQQGMDYARNKVNNRARGSVMGWFKTGYEK